MFTPFYTAFLALAMMGSVISSAAGTSTVEAATTDTAYKTSLVSVVSDCPDYPNCTPALDGTGNRWGQDASTTLTIDSTGTAASSNTSSSEDTAVAPSYTAST